MGLALGEFFFDAFALQAGEVVNEEDAVQVVDFVLDADAKQAFRFGFATCAAEVVVGIADGFRTFDVGKLAGQRQATFLPDGSFCAVADDFGIDEDYFRLLRAFRGRP